MSSSSGARKVSSGAVAKTGANAKKEKGAEGANEEEADAKSKKVVCNAKFCNKLCRERGERACKR